jgi:uncharacterized MAPEG superfamily protein
MTALTALLLFTAWTALLALIYAVPRVPQVLLGKRRADAWTRGNPSIDPPILMRAQHAHLNCVENLPLFAAVVLVAVALGQTGVVDPVAAWVLYARVAQSVVHLIGTSFILVFARATFFLAQIALILYMIWGLI